MAAAGADLRRACTFFGERRACGAPAWPWPRIPRTWCELFRLLGEQPVLWEAVDGLVRRLAEAPEVELETMARQRELGRPPDGWRERLALAARAGRPDRADGCRDRLTRFLMGRVMGELRGRVPARDVMAALQAGPGGGAMTDPLRGYRGLARSRLEAWGVRVWSDVRVTNSRGSVFEGVILPRSESFDDLHLVLKLRNGYNVGVHVDRVTASRRSVTGKPSTRSPRRRSRCGRSCRR